MIDLIESSNLLDILVSKFGLNLTSVDIVIHYDPWWNMSDQNQAIDRTYRMGQKNKVKYLSLQLKMCLRKIKKMQGDKQSLTDSVLSNEHTMISTLTAEEILYLFE